VRRQLNRSFSDDIVERTAKKIMNDYSGKKIYNLDALALTYAGKLKPDMRVKAYNPGTGQFTYMSPDQWEKIKSNTELQFEAYELG
jgi:hypothetical protein